MIVFSYKKQKRYFLLFLLFISIFQPLSAKQNEEPYWLKSNYSGKHLGKVGFVGQSKTWNSQETVNETLLMDEACDNALKETAKFLGVRIISNVSVSTEANRLGTYQSSKQHSSMDSDVEIDGASRTATYVKQKKNSIYNSSYCLIELSSVQIRQIKLKRKKNKEYIDSLVVKMTGALNEKDFETAQLTIIKLKNTNVDKIIISELSKLLAELKLQLVEGNILLAKEHFKEGEYLSFIASTNHKAYVYIFLEGEEHTKMLAPSATRSFNLLAVDDVFQYPSKNQIKKRDAYRISKRMKKEPQLRLVTSIKPLQVNFVKSSFNGFFVSDEKAYQYFVLNCERRGACNVKKYNLLVEKGSVFEISSYKIKINNKHTNAYNYDFERIMDSNKIISTKNGNELVINIEINRSFSSRLGRDIYVLTGELININEVGERSKRNHSRITGEFDENKLHYLVSKLLGRLIKGAL